MIPPSTQNASLWNRRDFGKLAAALPAAALAAKPDSKFGGVQIGCITYSFRQLPSTAADVLRYCTGLGISSIELMGDVAESFAGAPAGGPRGRREMTPELREAMRKAADDRRRWRLSASMDRYKELRMMFNNAGVSIDLFKLPLTAAMSDDECEYVFQVAKSLGAKCITMELPSDAALSERAGKFGSNHRIYVGYHNHMQVNAQSWDTALGQSKYNSINLDVGHFTQAISASPIPFIREHHARISSFHLKDKKYGSNGGGNTVWGQGQTPLVEILQLMAKAKYSWPANIELEYDIPAGSDVLAEMAKCVGFCRKALS
ncbi:MAG: sugar phosphate isomerase/epimerase [Bryobacteraceae bacterium]